MNTNLSLEKCLAFVNCQLQPPRKGSGRNGHNRRLAVTFSRQAGCGARAIAEKLAQRLQERGAGAVALTQHESDALVKNAATILAAKHVGKSLGLDAEEVHFRFGLAA